MAEIINQRYELQKLLGQGGFGAVYQGRDILLNRQVAIKRIHGFQLSHETRERFLDEARVTSQLTHRCVLTLFDFGFSQQGPYLVSELLQGAPLQDYMDQHQFTLAQGVHLLQDIAEALSEAHQLGVVHRDIKPANIFMHCPPRRSSRSTTKVELRLLDFGIAKILEQGASSIQTRAGMVMGTPAFMAPEQIEDSSTVDHRCDIYSLGLLIWATIKGELPFKGDTRYDLMRLQLREPLPPLDIDEPGGKELEALIQKMTAKKAKDRYQTLGDMLDELDKLIHAIPNLKEPEPLPLPVIHESSDSKNHNQEGTFETQADIPDQNSDVFREADTYWEDDATGASESPINHLTTDNTPVQHIDFSIENVSSPTEPQEVDEPRVKKTEGYFVPTNQVAIDNISKSELDQKLELLPETLDASDLPSNADFNQLREQFKESVLSNNTNEQPVAPPVPTVPIQPVRLDPANSSTKSTKRSDSAKSPWTKTLPSTHEHIEPVKETIQVNSDRDRSAKYKNSEAIQAQAISSKNSFQIEQHTEVVSHDQTKDSSSKTYLFLVLLLGLVSGGGYLFIQSTNTNQEQPSKIQNKQIFKIMFDPIEPPSGYYGKGDVINVSLHKDGHQILGWTFAQPIPSFLKLDTNTSSIEITGEGSHQGFIKIQPPGAGKNQLIEKEVKVK